MNGIFDKLFSKDKFDSELKSTLKQYNCTIVSKSDNGIYEVDTGFAKFKLDCRRARAKYEKSQSEEELAAAMKGVEKECEMESRMVSFTNGQEFLRFVIMPEENVKRNMISADFAEGLKKVIVYTADNVRLKYPGEDYLKRWDVPKEVLFSVADRNMCRLLSTAKMTRCEVAKNIPAMELELPSKRLSASLMMCNDFRRIVSAQLGEKFLVVAPSEDSLLVLGNINGKLLKKLGSVIIKEYRQAERPLTTNVLMFTHDSVQTAGHFSVKE